MEVFQLKNPRALMLPNVQEIIKTAFESISFAAPHGFDSTANDVLKYVIDANFFLILGTENGQFNTMAMGFYPGDMIFPYPTITMFYSRGSKALLQATGRKLVDILGSAGYTTAWAVNATGHKNAAWARLFRLPGTTEIKPLGSVMELKVT